MPALSMVFIYKIFFIFHIFLCFSLTIHPKAQYTYQKRKNSTGRLGVQHQVASLKRGAWVENTGDMQITYRRSSEPRFRLQGNGIFSKSFPKVFDEKKTTLFE